jgi:hypothetical protein
MGVAALVLGLLGVAVCWFPLLGWAGVGLGVLGFAVGIVAIKKGVKGLGIAGLLLGLIAILWGVSVQLEYVSAAERAAEEQELDSPPSKQKRPETQAPTPPGAERGERL